MAAEEALGAAGPKPAAMPLQLRKFALRILRSLVKRMKFPSSRLKIPALVLAGGVVFFGVGCANIFVPKHKVLVDAISLPGIEKPSGQSYRLVARRSTVNQAQVQLPVLKACVDAALTSSGLYEAPPNSPSDLFIEVSYGRDSTPRVDPAMRETFLQLSARSNPTRALDRSAGEELWDVRVAVLGLAGRVETALPLLCSVAASYIATNTYEETKIDVPQNSPEIAAIRDTAIRSLEGKSAPISVPIELPPLQAPPPETTPAPGT
jgi:hypothetical protein